MTTRLALHLYSKLVHFPVVKPNKFCYKFMPFFFCMSWDWPQDGPLWHLSPPTVWVQNQLNQGPSPARTAPDEQIYARKQRKKN
jgi:hypothetical protein